MVITRNRWPLDRSQVATTNWPSVAQVVLAAPGRVVWPIVNVVDDEFQLPAAPMKTENVDYAVFVPGMGEAVDDGSGLLMTTLPTLV